MTQKEAILKHLKRGRKITPLEALNMYGCFRLAAVIHVIRKELKPNEQLHSVPTGGKKYATYYITKTK